MNKLCSLFTLIILSFFLLFFHLDERPLLSSGEARASEIALEMLQTKNFFVPRLNEEIILTKPPLFHWLIILCYKMFGVSEFSSRFISALAGVLVILIVYLLGKRLWDKETGFIAGLLLLTSPLFFWSARCARIDSLLLFFITITMYCFWRGYEKLPSENKWFLLWFLFMGLGAMAKGPIAVAAPLGTAIIFFLLIGKKSYIKKLNWLKGLLIFILIISPWFIAIYFLVPHNKAEFFYLQQNKAWFQGGQHGEWYKGYVYIPHLFLGFFPWSLALPLVCIYIWRDFRNKKDEKLIFLWAWFILVFSIFFFFGKKVSRYILPAYPSVALLAAYIICKKKNIYRIFLYVLLFIWIIGILSLWSFNLYSHYLDGELVLLIVKHVSRLAVTIIGLIVVAIGLYGLKKNSLISSAIIVFISLGVFIMYAIPVEKDYYSPKPFCEMLKQTIPQDAELRAYKSWDNTIRYYYGRHVDVMKTEEEFIKYINSKDRVYCFMWEKVYKKLPVDLSKKIFVVQEGYKVLERKMVLVSNRP